MDDQTLLGYIEKRTDSKGSTQEDQILEAIIQQGSNKGVDLTIQCLETIFKT